MKLALYKGKRKGAFSMENFTEVKIAPGLLKKAQVGSRWAWKQQGWLGGGTPPVSGEQECKSAAFQGGKESTENPASGWEGWEAAPVEAGHCPPSVPASWCHSSCAAVGDRSCRELGAFPQTLQPPLLHTHIFKALNHQVRQSIPRIAQTISFLGRV